MKKVLMTITGICLILCLFGCNDDPNSNPLGTNFSTITISGKGEIELDSCVERGLDNKYIMLESKYCGHCKETLPYFKEACNEKGLTPIILDISIDEQREQMESYGIDIRFTPTFIIDCKYFVGAKSKEEYSSLLENKEVHE